MSWLIDEFEKLYTETEDSRYKEVIAMLQQYISSPRYIDGDAISVGNIADRSIVAIGRDNNLVVNQLALPDETIKHLEWLQKQNATNSQVVTTYLNWLQRELKKQIDQKIRAIIILTAIDTPEAIESLMFQFAVPSVFYKSEESKINTSITAKKFATFREAFEFHNQRVLLLGEPGMGKTTTLLTFALEKIADRLLSPSEPIPILANIHRWDTRTSFDQWIETEVPSIVDFRDEPLLYLLDGLDELGGKRSLHDDDKSPDPRKMFIDEINKLSASPLVITCRANDYWEIEEKVKLPGAVTLRPLGDEQIQGYLSRLERQDLWDVLKNDKTLLDIARTPLLLALLMVIFGSGEEKLNVNTQIDIFDQYIRGRFKYENERLTKNKKLNFTEESTRQKLEDLAVHMWLSRNSTTSIPKSNAVKVVDSAEFIDFAKHMHFLEDAQAEEIRFVHLKLRDYCAVTGLINALKEPDIEPDQVRRALTGIGSQAVPKLLMTLKDPDASIRFNVALVLGEIGDPNSAQELVDLLLQDSDDEVRDAATWALGVIGGEEVLDQLFKIWQHDSSEAVRERAFWALADMRSPALPILLELRKRIWMRDDEFFDLLTWDDARDATMLIASLDPTETIRESFEAQVLIRIGYPTVPSLLGELHGPDRLLKSMVIQILGEIGDPFSVPYLIKHLEDTTNIHWSKPSISNVTIEALRKIGTREALDAIEQYQAR